MRERFKARVARGLLPVEDAERSEHDGGCRTDGGDTATVGIMLFEQFGERFELGEVFRPRHATGADQPVAIRKVGAGHHDVGSHGDSVGAGHHAVFVD